MSEITFEQRAFRALNAVVEPGVRSGLLSCSLAPTTLVLLEHVGRRSGRSYRVPLLASRAGLLWGVSTVRGRRSQWLLNLDEAGEADVWIGGRRRRMAAWVALPGSETSAPEGWPVGTGLVVAGLRPAIAAGLGVALLGQEQSG